LAEATAIYDAGKEELIDREKHLILTNIQKITKQLHDGGGNLRLKWISRHSGIERNEEAVQQAKAATTLSHSSLDIRRCSCLREKDVQNQQTTYIKRHHT
jgi:ATP-dependent exoDNAse (exonuclease V) alpha subunit